jgi:TonB family protein
MDRFDCHDPDIGYLSRKFTGGLAMPISVILRGLVAMALAAVVAAPAGADIKAFNAAVRAGDYKTAAAEAEGIWKTWDASDEQTALIAREFGFASLVAGRNDLARQFGQFLVSEGARLKNPDNQPATSAVLLRVAEFKVKSGEAERKALRDALIARNGAAGVDMTSVLSWEALYMGSWGAADWAGAKSDALAAAEFLQREKSLIHRQRNAEVTSAAASFLEGRSRVTKGRNDYYVAMADAHDAIVGDLNAAASSPRNPLWSAKWKAEAWAMAIESFLQSSYAQIGSNISTRLDARPLNQPAFAQHPEDASALNVPMCEGRFEGRKLYYPANREFQGTVGAVIARMETDRDGKVTSAEVLAAVPADVFGEKVVETLRTWTFKPDKGVNTSACRMNSRNRIYKVSFRIM